MYTGSNVIVLLDKKLKYMDIKTTYNNLCSLYNKE